MNTSAQHIKFTMSQQGLAAGIAAYLMWGFFPIYFKVTADVSPLEVLSHRIVWSLPFGLLIIWARHQWADVKSALLTPTTLGILTVSSIALSINWGVYIWAVQKEQVFQASLGYYINPLMYMLVGVVFFGENMTKTQQAAIVLAVLGVGFLAIHGGVIPWISLILAVSFTIYGVIRKQVEIGAMPGLLIETMILFIPAFAYLLVLQQTGTLKFLNTGLALDGLLVFAGPMTVLPLLFFAIAARRLTFATIGFLQFIAPTLQFFCAIYYGETFTLSHAVCFGLIWASVIVYSIGSALKSKAAKNALLYNNDL